MQYIYIYIIMKYVALILLNYEYIIYRSHLPRHLCPSSSSYSPANTKHVYNIYTMLDQRRRRWLDVVQMLYKCFVFAGSACMRT